MITSSVFAEETPSGNRVPSVVTKSVSDNEQSLEETSLHPKLSLLEKAEILLKEKSFKKKKQAVELLIEAGDKAGNNSSDSIARKWLENLLSGHLYQHRKDKTLVFVVDGKISNAISNALIENAQKKDFKKITTNNALRKQLRSAIARLDLSSPDAETRLHAVNNMLDDITPENAALFKNLANQEKNKNVKKAMQLGIALAALNQGSKEDKIKAIKEVAGSLHPSVRNRLALLADNEDKAIANAAGSALQKIESRIKMFGHAETLFFGISLGSVLVLAAIGLAITFGVMGVINMAHGELIMLGAYTTYLVQQLMPNAIDYSLFVAIPAAFMVSGLMGVLIERTVIRHLYGRPLETLLATFGISLILQQLVRTGVSPQNVPVSNPSWMSGSLEINSVLSLTLNRMYIVLFCLMVFFALYFLLRKSALGLQVRAVSQNRQMARAMGVRSARVDAMTFGLGSGVAGVAGVALSQLTNVGPNLGQNYIIDSFMVVVFGGVGNLWGTLIAGLSLGVINKVMEPWAGAVLAKILVLVFIILFIQKRPRGLFPQKGRAAGD